MLMDRLQAQKERCDSLTHQIKRECAHPHWDERRIRELKHERLSLEDEIARLEKQVREQRERHTSS